MSAITYREATPDDAALLADLFGRSFTETFGYLAVESFLLGLYNQGVFAGATPSEAFRVICDETNNPPEVEQSGTVICDVYVAPNTPGEFIVFRLQQKFTNT